MNSVCIGGIKLPGIVALSPMAGVSHIAYRGICREMGAAYAPTELVSARSIRYNGLDGCDRKDNGRPGPVESGHNRHKHGLPGSEGGQDGCRFGTDEFSQDRF